MSVTVQSLGIDRLPVDEQLALVREIWDHIIASGKRPKLSEAQLQELRQRVVEDDADPDNLIPWADVKAKTLNLGLAANGSSRKWYVAVDEALDGNDWFLEIDGPQACLVFQLRDPKVVAEAMRFLQSPPGSGGAGGGEAAELLLGQFDSTSVFLIWDNEGFSRCFLVIGPKARSALRLSLEAEDFQMLIEALNQVMEDMPAEGRE